MIRILGWLAGRNVRPVTELRLQDGQLEILESNGEAAQGCPVCGTDGLLGEGDNQPLPTSEMDLVNVGKRG